MAWISRKLRNLLTLTQIIASIFNLKRVRVMMKLFSQTRFDFPFSPSWSQGGEDIVLDCLIMENRGFYIDVGAHHPDRFSVTRKLYERGWRGINIEANRDVERLFKKRRKRDEFLGVACGTKSDYTLTIFREPALNTTNREWAEKFALEGNEQFGSITVKGMRLREVFDNLDKELQVDLLNIDIEGTDYEALMSLDFHSLSVKQIPRWLILETTPPVKRSLEADTVKLAISYGYEPIVVLPMVTILNFKGSAVA